MRRRILYALLAALVVAGALWASSAQEAEPKEPDLEEYEPSEKVPADSSVSFPVDI